MLFNIPKCWTPNEFHNRKERNLIFQSDISNEWHAISWQLSALTRLYATLMANHIAQHAIDIKTYPVVSPVHSSKQYISLSVIGIIVCYLTLYVTVAYHLCHKNKQIYYKPDCWKITNIKIYVHIKEINLLTLNPLPGMRF